MDHVNKDCYLGSDHSLVEFHKFWAQSRRFDLPEKFTKIMSKENKKSKREVDYTYKKKRGKN